MSVTVLTLLSLLECPSLAILEAAAVSHLAVGDEAIGAQIARVRSRHWLPRISVRAFANDASSVPLNEGVSTAGTWRGGVGADVRLTFQLPDLVYDEHEATLRRDALMLARERRELARLVVTLGSRLAALRDELRQSDVTAGEVFAEALPVWLELDSLSGGACRLAVKEGQP